MTIRLEVESQNFSELIAELNGLLRGNVRIELPTVTVTSTEGSATGQVDIGLHKAPAPTPQVAVSRAFSGEPTPLEAAIAVTTAPNPTVADSVVPRTDVAKFQEATAKVADQVMTPSGTKPRGRPRKEQKQAPAGAPEGIEPSVPASQPAVENTGSDSLPPSPSVGDVVTAPAAEAKAPVAGADAAACRKALQELSARIGGNDGLDAVAEVIGRFGFNKVSQITPDTHDGIIAAANVYQKPE